MSVHFFVKNKTIQTFMKRTQIFYFVEFLKLINHDQSKIKTKISFDRTPDFLLKTYFITVKITY